MSHERVPLVLTATRSAIDDARRLLDNRVVLENAVGRAIRERRITHRPALGEFARVEVGSAVVTVRRERAPSGRLAWRPVAVRAVSVPGHAVPTAPTGVGDSTEED